MLLSTAYLPPIYYVALIYKHPVFQVEKFEHYIKQSYRNRATILSANGPLDLIMPLEKKDGCKTTIKDVTIAYNDRWNAEHWNAIVSAYNSSPFFEYYKDNLQQFFTKRYTYLLDYNANLLQCILQLLKIKYESAYTNDFIALNTQQDDFRYSISPKIKTELTFPKYTQVFEDKFSFVPNLSILDLLCNVGPDSKSYLEQLSNIMQQFCIQIKN